MNEINQLSLLPQILYEISMSIGASTNLDKMLRQFSRTALRKLNGTAIVIFRKQACGNAVRFVESYVSPRSFTHTQYYASLKGALPEPLESDQVDSFQSNLPAEIPVEKDGCIHLMDLPDYGLIAIFRAKGALPEEYVNSLETLNRKLSVACLACLIYQDLEQKVAERTADLERSNEELKQFAYVASHDLQEPVRMVNSFLELLQRDYADQLDKNANEYIRFALDGAIRMKSLISGLLSLSRVGTHGNSFERVDMGNALKQAIDNLSVTISESGAKISYADLPEAYADQIQIIQLFQNLIENAIKYMPDDRQPEIKVYSEPDGNLIRISVQDNGIGIDEEYADHIFLVFKRLHQNDSYSGSGIGLSVCKKIVERHGGKIRVQSNPGQGSIFNFTLKPANL